MSPTTHKQSKKRSAPAQSGPKSKKPHLEAPAEPKAKKRSRPVTVVAPESDGESSDGGSGDELPENDELEGAEEEEETGEEMDVAEAKDPNGASARSHSHCL